MIKIRLHKELHTSDGNVLLKVDFEVNKGEVITIYGKSGAGKTSILRMVAGLLQPDNGNVAVNNIAWYKSAIKLNLPPQRRRVGFVFQDYALFPNMTVRGNLEFASKNNKKVSELLQLMQLEPLANRKPETLSGGQKQRVALARALVFEPEILLLDEPLSALDHEMRLELQNEILSINKRFGTTILLVSHDLSEIFKLSDRVLVIDKGQMVNYDTPLKVFSNNTLSAKFQFVGEILDIKPADVIYIVSVLIGNAISKIVATPNEIKQLNVGDKVIVATKAFNPIIIPLKSSNYSTRIKNTWIRKGG